MNTSRFKFKKEFHNTGSDFSASNDAEKWLRERGYGIGTMQHPDPRAIEKGATYLPKWKHYNHEETEKLDGVALSDDSRNGTVTVYLTEEPK